MLMLCNFIANDLLKNLITRPVFYVEMKCDEIRFHFRHEKSV